MLKRDADVNVNTTLCSFGNDANSGAQRVEIDHVLVYGQPGGPIPNTTVTAVAGGSAFDLGAVSDTSTVRDCILWFFGSGTGIKIGRGSEVGPNAALCPFFVTLRHSHAH